MLIGFGVIVLAVIGALAASLSAPLAVVVGGVSRLRGARRGGLATGFLTWVALTTAGIVALFLGLAGDAGSGVRIFGADLEELLALAPWAWLLAALAGVGFFAAARARTVRRPGPP